MPHGPVPRALIRAGAVSFALVVALVVTLARPGASDLDQDLGNVAQLAAALVAAGACARAAWRGGPEARGWALLSVALHVWAAGGVLWLYYSVRYDHVYPFPSLADAGFLGYFFPAAAGLLLFPREDVRRVSRVRAALDALLVATSVLFVSAATVLGPLLGAEGLPTGSWLISVAYPVVDVVICSLVLILALRRPPGARLPWVFLGGGLVSLTVTDSVYAALVSQGGSMIGTPLQAGWTAAFLLIALATLVPVGRMQQARTHFTVMQELLPYVPVLVAAVVVARRTEPIRLSDPGLAVLGATLLVVVVAQQVLVALEKVRLAEALESDVVLRSQQLRTAEDRFRSLVDSSDDVIFSRTIDGVIMSWNPAAERLFGYSAEEAIGRGSELIVPPELLGEEREVREGAAAGLRRRYETRRRRKDGTIVPVALTVSPILDGDRVEGVSVIGNDITERQRNRQALAAARDQAVEGARAKSEFLATMSHEIRTPMNGVVGLTGLLLDTPLDDVQRRYVTGVQGAGQALMAIIDDILDFSKLEAGKVEIEQEEFDPRGLVEDVGLLLAPTASAHGLELLAFCAPQMPARLRGDAGRLRQILLNLSSNAIKFTNAGEVVVRADVLPEAAEAPGVARVRFAVTDTGIGIDAATASRLFQPFTQADASTTRQFGGTGLGLAICQRLVHAMGGRIELESAPGRGSTFSFTLDFPVVAPVRPLGMPMQLSGARVLVVDDNATTRAVLGDQLVAWNLRPHGVPDGPAALDALRRARARGEPFDLAILDLQMPGMTGLALAAAMTADPALAPVRKLLLAPPDAIDAAAAAAAGVREWASKPVRSSELHDALVRLVAGPSPAVPAAAPDVAPQPEASRGRVLVGDGRQALDILDRERFDVVLMDCHMPVMDGFTATREIRRREEAGGTARLPVIAMTAGVLEEDRQRCEAAGMDDFVSKPVAPAVLDRVLRRYAPRAALAGADRGIDPSRLDVLRGLDPDDGLLRAVIRAFADDAPARLEAIRAAAAAGGGEPLARAAHELAGAAANVGAARVAELCRQLEADGRAGAAPRRELVEGLAVALDHATGQLASAVRSAG